MKFTTTLSKQTGPATLGAMGGAKEQNKGLQKAETTKAAIKVKMLLLYSHSKVCRIQKFFLSDNHGGQQYFLVSFIIPLSWS